MLATSSTGQEACTVHWQIRADSSQHESSAGQSSFHCPASAILFFCFKCTMSRVWPYLQLTPPYVGLNKHFLQYNRGVFLGHPQRWERRFLRHFSVALHIFFLRAYCCAMHHFFLEHSTDPSGQRWPAQSAFKMVLPKMTVCGAATLSLHVKGK